MRKFLLPLLLLLTACSSAPHPQLPTHLWSVSLRALDPADTSTPAHDITAVYLRKQDDTLQIRIDLLDFNNPKDLSIDIQIESESTPKSSPLIIHIPSQTDSARITLDPQLATVIIDIPPADVPSHPRINISTPEDQLTDITLDSPTVTETAPLLLTFYDTFAARLPAEALRSWDGAHTGPRGERHGLKHLLDAAEEYQIPIVLLDLKDPENMSALDAMELLSKIAYLENQGALNFPESKLEFVFLEDSTHLYKPIFSKSTYIPIPTETDSTQPTPDGPSLEVRRTLLDVSLNNDDTDLLVLGGSFANSTWGSPDMVGKMMAYFASRPYIHVLNSEDLNNFSANANNAIIPQPESPIDEKVIQIQEALSFAQNWAEKPTTEPDLQCGSEFLKCTLSNQTLLAIFDPKNASLLFLFSVERDTISPNLHQLIGPPWQVAPGIDSYPTAFTDDKTYTASINKNALVFTSTDGARTKIFTLTASGLEVRYQTDDSVIVQIPLLVDPDVRFTSGWAEKYIGETTINGIRWGLEDGPKVEIRADGPVTMRAFNQDLSLLQSPEGPNFSYPPGHYVPFGMAIAEIKMDSPSSTVHINIEP